MIRRASGLVIGCYLLQSVLTYCQRDIDAQVRSILLRQNVPGAAIAIVRDGKLIKEIIYGSASLQLTVPVRKTTKFQLASVTKIFTAAALFELEQQGKLNVDEPLSKYISGLPVSWGQVKLRELASHTSGLPDIIKNPNAPLTSEELNRSGDEALRMVEQEPLVAPPGSKFQYDQTNYLLLQRVIETTSGRRFREFLHENVLMEMPGTVWGDARSIIFGRSEMYTALHHDKVENGTDLYLYPDYLDAAAGLNSTLVDMEQFAIRLTDGQILPSSELEKMWRPATDRSGKVVDIGAEMGIKGMFAPANGWFYADNSGGKYPRVFMAGGSSTSVVVLPKQRLCIVVLTNLQATDDPLPIAEQIAKGYIPELKPML